MGPYWRYWEYWSMGGTGNNEKKGVDSLTGWPREISNLVIIWVAHDHASCYTAWLR